MKKNMTFLIGGIIFLSVAALVLGPLGATRHARACNWGSPGGQDYVPQKRSSVGPLAKAPSLSKEQAFDVVSKHIQKLNADLKIGQIKDAGNFFEAEILGYDDEVLERLAVDKSSGRLIPLN